MSPRPILALAPALVVALAPPALADDDDARQCLAEAVYYEARGTSDRSREAVAHVVLNRAESPEFPDTICGVTTDECQFSYECDGKAETMAHTEDRAAAYETAGKVLAGEAPDPTDGALYFHADELEPSWFATRSAAVEIGGHIFYR
jgi:N-acetylmuramoyl-L-alanine amidase